MIAAVVALAAVAVVLACVLGAVLRGQHRERGEWATERRQLVDRAIARHAGEVIAFDRSDKPKKDVDPMKLVEGLS